MKCFTAILLALTTFRFCSLAAISSRPNELRIVHLTRAGSLCRSRGDDRLSSRPFLKNWSTRAKKTDKARTHNVRYTENGFLENDVGSEEHSTQRQQHNDGSKAIAKRISGGAAASISVNNTVAASARGGESDIGYGGGQDKIASRSSTNNPQNEDDVSSLSSTLSQIFPFGERFGHEDLSSAKKYSKRLKNRNKLNMGRKTTHAACGLLFATLNQCIPRKFFLAGMTALTTGTLIMELLRYRRGFGWMNDALHTVLGGSLRKHEMEGKFTGSFYYFLGVTVTVFCYPKTAATLGICQLAIADPSASYFGRRTKHIYWSRIENGLMGLGRNKGILGFLGGAFFCLPFNYRMLSVAKWGAMGIPGGNATLLSASLALGFAGAFADLAVPTPAVTMPDRICGVRVPPFHIDDNFVVPLFSAFACTKIFDFCGWSQGLPLSKTLFIRS